MQTILGGILLIALGLPLIIWPHAYWKFKMFGIVRVGEPTDFSILMIRITGALAIIGSLFLFVHLAK